MNDVAAADMATTGIYMVQVSMRLMGDMNNIEKLLDDLAYTDKKLRLVSYDVETETVEIPHEDETVELLTSDILNLTVELYMCQE